MTELLIHRVHFSLTQEFLHKFDSIKPAWGPLGELVYLRTYAMEKSDGTVENWQETCQRVVEATYSIQKGHCLRYHLPWSDVKAQRSAQNMYTRMFYFKWTPPGRGLAKMGHPALWEIGSACINNCGFVSTADLGNKNKKNAFSSPFTWMMHMSSLGVGVGFDTLGAGTVTVTLPTTTTPHLVGDSKQGWCAYLELLLESLVTPGTPLPAADYRLVRPYGAPIKTFGGYASGPEALVVMTKGILKLAEMYNGKKIDSKFIVYVANLIGEAIVSGGVRRTAEIALGSPTDVTFLNLKNYKGNPEATLFPSWASNNTVMVNEETDFSFVAPRTAENGEPGYFFLENARAYGRMKDPINWADKEAVGGNPCLEQTLHNYELCTLVQTYPANCDSYEDYQETLKFAYLYAKTVTLCPTHSPETNAVLLKNRRIGCSQSGVQDNIEKIGLRAHLSWCDRGYNYLKNLDTLYSNWLCIPKSIKLTSIQPGGTTGKLTGGQEGIHLAKGQYEIQRIRIENTSPLLRPLADAGYDIEADVKVANTSVVSFPMKYARNRTHDATMWEQLETAALMQYYWCDNQTSVTIDFDKATEGPEIARALAMYAHRLKGVSFLPRDDHQYVQAPKTVITQIQYEEYCARLRPVDFTAVKTNVHDSDDKFCTSRTCEIVAEAAQ